MSSSDEADLGKLLEEVTVPSLLPLPAGFKSVVPLDTSSEQKNAAPATLQMAEQSEITSSSPFESSVAIEQKRKSSQLEVPPDTVTEWKESS